MKAQIAKVDLVTANKAYTLTIPRDTVMMRLQTRDGTAWRWGLTENEVAENVERVWSVISISSQAVYDEDGLELEEPLTIFIACGSNSKVLEALFWLRESVAFKHPEVVRRGKKR